MHARAPDHMHAHTAALGTLPPAEGLPSGRPAQAACCSTSAAPASPAAGGRPAGGPKPAAAASRPPRLAVRARTAVRDAPTGGAQLPGPSTPPDEGAIYDHPELYEVGWGCVS
jgi:hypothetical protein